MEALMLIGEIVERSQEMWHAGETSRRIVDFVLKSVGGLLGGYTDAGGGSEHSGGLPRTLKGQFFAVRSKVEQENIRKRGFVAMVRSLLNGFV